MKKWLVSVMAVLVMASIFAIPSMADNTPTNTSHITLQNPDPVNLPYTIVMQLPFDSTHYKQRVFFSSGKPYFNVDSTGFKTFFSFAPSAGAYCYEGEQVFNLSDNSHYSAGDYYDKLTRYDSVVSFGFTGQIVYADYTVNDQNGNTVYTSDHDYTSLTSNHRTSLNDALLHPFYVNDTNISFDTIGKAFTGNPFQIAANVSALVGQIYKPGVNVTSLTADTNKANLKYELVLGYEDIDQLNKWDGLLISQNMATINIVYSSQPITAIVDSDGNTRGWKTYLQSSTDQCNYTTVLYDAINTKQGLLGPVSLNITAHSDQTFHEEGTQTLSNMFTKSPLSDKCQAVYLWSDQIVNTDNGTPGGDSSKPIYNPPTDSSGNSQGSTHDANSIWNGFNLLDPTTWLTPVQNAFDMIHDGISGPVNSVVGLYQLCMSWMPSPIVDLLVFGFMSAVILLIFGRR